MSSSTASSSLGSSQNSQKVRKWREQQPFSTASPPEQPLYNRKDQVYPDILHLYVFRSGDGLECSRVTVTGQQMNRGMAFVLELLSRKHGCNPSKLCYTDGQPINNVSELENKGSYVIVPVGESFRDTWYYMPDGALDTSFDARQKRKDIAVEEIRSRRSVPSTSTASSKGTKSTTISTKSSSTGSRRTPFSPVVRPRQLERPQSRMGRRSNSYGEVRRRSDYDVDEGLSDLEDNWERKVRLKVKSDVVSIASFDSDCSFTKEDKKQSGNRLTVPGEQSKSLKPVRVNHNFYGVRSRNKSLSRNQHPTARRAHSDSETDFRPRRNNYGKIEPRPNNFRPKGRPPRR